MNALFLISIFRLYSGIKLSFGHNSAHKNLLLNACFCWDSTLSLCEPDQKFNFGRPNGYCDSYLEFLVRHFKEIRLHAILHGAAGAVRAHNGETLGYCYMIGRGSSSCLLDPVTGLLFCLYVKLFLHSIFNSVNFWSGLSCNMLDIELADKIFIKKLGVSNDGNVQGYPFCPPLKYKPSKQWCKGWEFCNKNRKCKIFANWMGKQLENLEDHGCPNVRDLVDEEMWICSIYPFRHKTTLHWAERKAKLFSYWIMQQLNS